MDVVVLVVKMGHLLDAATDAIKHDLCESKLRESESVAESSVSAVDCEDHQLIEQT